ncbi:hypothetical protein Tsubulata_026222 [Turnera subulata]|uniref:Uncharacterized protein n=1 Tax=Turnera subulata TaxID=218843 RepID=A0A9Q0GBP3_9ROSI|nr:hypothetical protein Tsubulata_026222 [Turnera subulata]
MEESDDKQSDSGFISTLQVHSAKAKPLDDQDHHDHHPSLPPVHSISIVVDTLPPTATNPAAGGTPPPPGAEQNHTPPPPNPILAALRQQDMGRHTLFLSCQVATALISAYNGDITSLVLSVILVFISLGFAATMNGILLRDMYPRAATAVELLGVGFVILSFFSFVGNFLPSFLAWIPAMCFALSMLPLVIAACYYSRERPP